MAEFMPMILLFAIIAVLMSSFGIAYLLLRKKLKKTEYSRSVSDKVLIKRLLGYAKPYTGTFILVLVIMLVSVAYDILSPIIVGDIEEMIKEQFQLNDLLIKVGLYAGILIVSMVSMYLQTMLLQKVGQKILSDLREDVFSHIESLSTSS